MTHPWFRTFGWTYRPVSWHGYTVVSIAAIFCVQVFLAIDQHSHSASDTLRPFLITVGPVWVVGIAVARTVLRRRR